MKKAALVLFFALACGCTERNRVQTSPSGSYQAYLSISQCPDGYGIWVVNITTGEDEVDLLEFMNDYPANLMAYIAWDHNDRLWFFSSDDGRHFYWERVGDGQWNRYSWSILESSSLTPPESLDEPGERN